MNFQTQKRRRYWEWRAPGLPSWWFARCWQWPVSWQPEFCASTGNEWQALGIHTTLTTPRDIRLSVIPVSKARPNLSLIHLCYCSNYINCILCILYCLIWTHNVGSMLFFEKLNKTRFSFHILLIWVSLWGLSLQDYLYRFAWKCERFC